MAVMGNHVHISLHRVSQYKSHAKTVGSNKTNKTWCVVFYHCCHKAQRWLQVTRSHVMENEC